MFSSGCLDIINIKQALKLRFYGSEHLLACMNYYFQSIYHQWQLSLLGESTVIDHSEHKNGFVRATQNCAFSKLSFEN